MSCSLPDLHQILADTPLCDRPCCVLPILETGEKAFALEIGVKEIEQSWQVARALIDRTGRYPIVSSCWNAQSSFVKRLEAADLFSRFYFQEAMPDADVSPRSLIRSSEGMNVRDFLASLQQKRLEDDDWEDWDSILEYELQQTQIKYGAAPSLTELDQANLRQRSSRLVLDRWLWNWELAQRELAQGELGQEFDAGERFDWFEPDNAVLLFLPTPSSWETLAYLHWYGAYENSDHYIALGKSWEQRFGAELVAHYGTMLQCKVSQPPQAIDLAWDLALEHDLAAPYSLAAAGVSLRHYAQGLINSDRWFLHERP